MDHQSHCTDMPDSSEQHRHRCEVRQVLKWTAKDSGAGKRYLQAVERARGKDAADTLRKDLIAQWKAGNRGAEGDWRET